MFRLEYCSPADLQFLPLQVGHAIPCIHFLPPQVSHGAIFVLVKVTSRQESVFLVTCVVDQSKRGTCQFSFKRKADGLVESLPNGGLLFIRLRPTPWPALTANYIRHTMTNRHFSLAFPQPYRWTCLFISHRLNTSPPSSTMSNTQPQCTCSAFFETEINLSEHLEEYRVSDSQSSLPLS